MSPSRPEADWYEEGEEALPQGSLRSWPLEGGVCCGLAWIELDAKNFASSTDPTLSAAGRKLGKALDDFHAVIVEIYGVKQ